MAPVIRIALVAVLALQVACGTLLYPQRRNQKPTGRLDPGVVAMDVAWMLVFIVPGVAALVVDFATGAIYLPEGEKHFLESRSGANRPVLVLEPGTLLGVRAPEGPVNDTVWDFELRQAATSGVVASWTWEAEADFEIEVPPALVRGVYEMRVLRNRVAVGHLPLLIG